MNIHNNKYSLHYIKYLLTHSYTYESDFNKNKQRSTNTIIFSK
jgi:hypothetical protein